MSRAALPPQHVTKQQFAYTALRDAIVGCELAPGQRLVIDELAHRFNVSIIPVREALRLLESEGLVVTVAHTGTTVAPVSRQLIVEVFAMLEGLETVSGRAAAEAIAAGRGDTRRLRTLLTRMDRALAAQRAAGWAELNGEFHLAISTLSGMPLVEQMLSRALMHWDRVRRFFFSGVLTHRAARAQREHHRIITQLEAGDADGVERTLRSHNRGALHAYLNYLDAPAARRRA
jgi:DNA-binding GntR family transcriptional regulator